MPVVVGVKALVIDSLAEPEQLERASKLRLLPGP
jgi:hypothetical protein